MALIMGAAGLARTAYAARKQDLKQERDPEDTIKIAAAIKSIVESTKEDLSAHEDSVGFWAMTKRRLEVSIASAATGNSNESGKDAAFLKDAAKNQRSAIAVVKSLTKNGTFSVSMKNDAATAHVVVPLVRLIRSGVNEGVKVAATEALGLLVALSHAKNQDLALKAGAIEAVLLLMKSNYRSTTRTTAARTLASQIRGHHPSMNAVRHQGGVVVIVDMLQDSSRPEEMDAGLDAAGWLMADNRLNQTSFGESGLIEPLINVLTDSEFVGNVKGALWVLTMLVKCHERNLKLATDTHEVFPLVVRHLDLNSVRPTSRSAPKISASMAFGDQQYAIAAIVEFVRDNRDRAQRAIDYGAPKLLRRLTRPQRTTWRSLLRPSTDTRLQRAARHALAMVLGKGVVPLENVAARSNRRKTKRRRADGGRSGIGLEPWWQTIISKSAPTLVGIILVALAVWVIDYLNTVTGFNYGFGKQGFSKTLAKWSDKLSMSNDGEHTDVGDAVDMAHYLGEQSSSGIDIVAEGLIEEVPDEYAPVLTVTSSES